MKKILISIKPKCVAKILSGEKTIEVRKTAPKCALPIDVYVYCTKDDKNPIYIPWEFPIREEKGRLVVDGVFKKLNGKIVAKFTLKTIGSLSQDSFVHMECGNGDYILKDACLSLGEIKDYAKGNDVYLWYVSDLEIFAEPKELNEFYSLKCNQKKEPCDIKDVFGVEECHELCKMCELLTKAPQSWCYVEERE